MMRNSWKRVGSLVGLGIIAAACAAACGGSSDGADVTPGPAAGGGSGGAAGASGAAGHTGGAAGAHAGAGGTLVGGASAGHAGAPAGGKGGTSAGGSAGHPDGSSGNGSGGKGTAGTGGNGTAGSGTAGSGTGGNGTAGDTGTGGDGTAGSGGDTGTGGDGTAGAGGDTGTGGDGTAGAGGDTGTGGDGTAGSAGAPAACTAGAPCTVGTDNGLCTGGTCNACNDPSDDATCTTVYGQPELCLAGSCLPGDCRKSADCAVVTDVCNGNTCAPCDGVGSTYFVDPINGDDVRATGSGTAGGTANSACSFKTVTAALKALVLKPSTAAITVDIIGPSTVGAGETFPFAIPKSTTVTASVGAVSIDVPASTTGFTFASTGSKIIGGTGLTIDGQGAAQVANKPQHGLNTLAGSDVSDQISQVTFTGFADEAILVNTGGLTIGAGVTVTGSGQAPAGGGEGTYAIRVGDGAAHLAADVGADEAAVHVDGNRGGGIVATGLSTVALNGVASKTTLGTGSFTVSGNGGIGFTARNGAVSGGTTIDGLVLDKNGVGLTGGNAGIRVQGGSTFTITNSVAIGNGSHGIHIVEPNGTISLTPVQNIILGKGGAFGENVFQDPTTPNKGTGICLDLPTSSNQTLLARGNIFSPNKDCSTTVATLTPSVATASSPCGGGTDLGVSGTNNLVDVKMCKSTLSP